MVCWRPDAGGQILSWMRDRWDRRAPKSAFYIVHIKNQRKEKKIKRERARDSQVRACGIDQTCKDVAVCARDRYM
jgi:hypothetical protein